MRRPKLYPIVALLGAAVAGGPTIAHAQGLRDVRAIKPVMMLLVDTSGSMERLPDVGTQVDKLPECTNSAADLSQKNRWAVTLEALTGTFQNFRCARRDRRTAYPGAFDENYFLPHYDFTTNATQVSDGVLDAFKSRLKFGLMTFDGVNTTVEGETLVEYEKYGQAGNPLNGLIDGRQGMYSYPQTTESESDHGWMRLFFPGCPTYYGINAGARGKGSEPGSLISVGLSDSSSEVLLTNQKIQNDLLKVRPYGGTPIAGMLDDLRYYLNNDADVKRNSDPYYECRQRFALLLTDGAPDAMFRGGRFNCETITGDTTCEGDDCCPYDTEVNITKKLVGQDGLEKLFVVAFNVNDTGAMNTLNKISVEGNGEAALNAQTPDELRSALDKIMRIAQPDSTSRSVPVVVNTGKPVLLGGKHYEIVAGFKIGQNEDEPWQGTLLRRRITCDNTTPTPQPFTESEGDLFHIELNEQSATSGRTIHTVHPKPLVAGASAMRGNLYGADSNTIDSTAFSGTTLNTVRPDGLAFGPFSATDSTANSLHAMVDDGVLLASFDKDTPAVYFGDANKNGTSYEDVDRDAINAYLRGLSANRTDRTLGDIYHSNPVVLPPLAIGSEHLNAFDPNLRAFYTGLLQTEGTSRYGADGRPGVVFVGTNDGLLHAFNLDKWTAKGGAVHQAGHEFWSFVPPALFDKLSATVAPSHQTMFDGTPLVRDVVYKRLNTANNSGLKMGTVLLSAVRGAPAYIALDVTYPEEPKFLWQRAFPYLGNTVATPAIGHAKISWNGAEQVRAVAILPGGEGELDTSGGSECNVDQLSRGKAEGGRDKVRCWKLRGRSLYVVDVATGELLQEFDARHFHSPLTGAVAVDSEQLAITKAAYFTDEDGVLWRLSMVGLDPSKWRVQPIWDLFAGEGTDFAGNVKTVPTPTASAGRPATHPPLLTRNPKNGNLTILVGTGDVDNLTDNIPHRVVSLEELRKLDTSGEIGGTINKNWVLQLEPGESVTGPLVVYDNTLYFASFKGPGGNMENLCEMGTSRIVGAHVRDQEGSGLPKPMLVSPTNPKDMVLSYFPEDATNSLLLGLSISRDPVCIVGQRDPNAATTDRWQQTGAAGGGGYTLHSMVAGQGTENADKRTEMVGTDLRQLKRSLPIPNIVRSVGWASSVE